MSRRVVGRAGRRLCSCGLREAWEAAPPCGQLCVSSAVREKPVWGLGGRVSSPCRRRCLSSAVRPTPQAARCRSLGTGPCVGLVDGVRLRAGGLHGGGGSVSAAVSAVVLVDGVSFIDCMALRRGERGPELALSRVFSRARIECTAAMWWSEPLCQRRGGCRCDAQGLCGEVSGSFSSSSSVSWPAVCFHAVEFVKAKGLYVVVMPNTSCGLGVAHKMSRPVRGDILGRSMLANANLLRRAPDNTATVERHAADFLAVAAACGVSPMCHAVMSS